PHMCLPPGRLARSGTATWNRPATGTVSTAAHEWATPLRLLRAKRPRQLQIRSAQPVPAVTTRTISDVRDPLGLPVQARGDGALLIMVRSITTSVFALIPCSRLGAI